MHVPLKLLVVVQLGESQVEVLGVVVGVEAFVNVVVVVGLVEGVGKQKLHVPMMILMGLMSMDDLSSFLFLFFAEVGCAGKGWKGISGKVTSIYLPIMYCCFSYIHASYHWGVSSLSCHNTHYVGLCSAERLCDYH